MVGTQNFVCVIDTRRSLPSVEAVVAQRHKSVTVNATGFNLWVQFRIRGMNYIIFSFPHSSNKTKRGVESRHSTCNALRIRCLNME